MKSASATRLFPLRSLPFWRRHPAFEFFFDVGGDVDRHDVAQMGDAVPLTPGGEAACGPDVGFPGVRVADMGGEELDDAAVGLGRQQGRGPSLADPLHRYCGGGAAGSRQTRRPFTAHMI